MAESSVSMKLLIDTNKTRRVLFAEAGKECVDFLFHILSLPVATIIRLLSEVRMGGSLPKLYKSLQNLNNSYIQPGMQKDTFLKPVMPVSSSPLPLLALEGASSVGKKFYMCGQSQYGSSCSYVSDETGVTCPSHNRLMSSNMVYVAPPSRQVAPGDVGLVKGVVTYMVMDDLEVKPMSTISSLALLNTFKVKDVGALEEKVVTLGMKEAVKLLKISLESNTVLTELFC